MKYGLSFDVLGTMEKGFGKKLPYKGKHFCLYRIFAKFLHFLEPFFEKTRKDVAIPITPLESPHLDASFCSVSCLLKIFGSRDS